VLTLPVPLRCRVACDHQFQGTLGGLVLGALRRWLRLKAAEAGPPQGFPDLALRSGSPAP